MHHQLMIDSSSPGSGIQRDWTTEARTSVGWTENTLEKYAEINRTTNKFSTVILCALRFKLVWEFIQCCLTSHGYKWFRPADLRILYDAKTLGGEEIKRNLLRSARAALVRSMDQMFSSQMLTCDTIPGTPEGWTQKVLTPTCVNVILRFFIFKCTHEVIFDLRSKIYVYAKLCSSWYLIHIFH